MTRSILLLLLFLSSSLVIFAQDVNFQSEFEKNEGIMLKWNYNEAVDSAVTRIAAIISPDDKVWIIYDPLNSFTLSSIQTQLTACGANLSNILFIEGTAENPWLRDYGPVAGYYYDETTRMRHFLDAQYNPTQFPLADFLPLQLASDFNFNYEAMPLNFEGGNLLLDGIGRGFVGDRILSENPGLSSIQIVQTLYTKLSLNEIIILPSVPECGGGEWSELSRLIKFTDSETVLVSQFPENVPYYGQVEMIADTLSKTYNDAGKLLQVIRIPVAPDENGEFSVSASGIIRSYTSSIIFNNKILVPAYNQPTDAVAIAVYQKLFPGYQVFQVPSSALVAMHGSLYRLSVNIPQPELFRIRHSKHTGMQPFENEIWINSFVESWDPVDSIKLFYRVHPSTDFIEENTYGCCGGNSGFLSGYTISDTISYYIRAYSGDFSQTLPLAAPEGTFTFWFDAYTGTQKISENQQVTIYPNPTSGKIYINGIPLSNPGDSFQLFNQSGALVSESRISSVASVTLPGNLANGLYLAKVNYSGKTHICKLYLHH